MTAPRTFLLGGDLPVGRMGFGAMRLTGQPGNFGPYAQWAEGVALVRRAAELGVDFYDSAFAYGNGEADRLLGEALHGLDVVIATKGGVHKLAPGQPVVDCSRDTLLRQVDRALANLRRERIDLFQLHHVDPAVPLEISVAALAEAQADGRIRHIGLSNCTLEQVGRARAVAPIASVQNRLNISEDGDLEMARRLAEDGVAYIAYAPLGADPQVRGARIEPAAALGWLLRCSPNVIAIPGTTSPGHLEENMRLAELAFGGMKEQRRPIPR